MVFAFSSLEFCMHRCLCFFFLQNVGFFISPLASHPTGKSNHFVICTELEWLTNRKRNGSVNENASPTNANVFPINALRVFFHLFISTSSSSSLSNNIQRFIKIFIRIYIMHISMFVLCICIWRPSAFHTIHHNFAHKSLKNHHLDSSPAYVYAFSEWEEVIIPSAYLNSFQSIPFLKLSSFIYFHLSSHPYTPTLT